MSEMNGHKIDGSNKAWRKVKLGEIAKYINGKAFKPSEWEKTGLPIIRIQNLNNADAPFNYCNKEVDKKYYVSQGDLLFAWSGTPGTSFGAHIWKGKKAVLNQHIFRIEIDKEQVNRNYFQYALNFKVKEFVAKAHGTAGLAHITKGKFEIAEIFLPTLLEQRQIVSKIEELFSELDKSIEQIKTAQQQLKVYRQSVLKWAFEGKLTNENVKVKDVAQTFGGYAFKSGEFKVEGKYQVLRMGNVRPGLVRFDESPVFLDIVKDKVLEKSLLQINDVIITQTGTRKKRDYGFTALIPKSNLLVNQRIAAIRFDKSYLPKFFLYFSWTDTFKDQFFANETGNVGQGNVGMKAVTETLIPFCPMEEQKRIVEEIESRLSVSDKLEETITNSLQQAEALRQSILKKAFEGKLL
jgi:type I restriction enzyme, S subunit